MFGQYIKDVVKDISLAEFGRKELDIAETDALFVVDAEQTITYWNHQAMLLTGYSAPEVVGRHCLAGIRCEKRLYECKLFERRTIEDARIEIGKG